MKITLFTADGIRHKYLINLLSKSCESLFVVQENKVYNKEKKTKSMNSLKVKYFENVRNAEKKLFKLNNTQSNYIKNLKILPIEYKNLSMNISEEFLQSDLYIIFGSSYIKGDLAEFLIKQNALNIHAGISPYYRGADCNFWALFDNNPHLVGSTIHLLSNGLDDGPLLYHALSNVKNDPFEYTMSSVKSAFYSLSDRIKDKSIYNFKPITQNISNEIRFSKIKDFNDKSIEDFFTKKINLHSKKFNYSLLKDPYFFNC